jgi:2-polyprenyl-6-methoxyphenol hydroxylase-like FAD-dependent oxidoreductase
VLEHAIARVAAGEPRLDVRRGVRAAGLVLTKRAGRPPHVRGVRTADGEQLTADLVVDATGRRSPSPAWLRPAGVTVRERGEASGFVYYSRFFRSADGTLPAVKAPLNTPFGSINLLTLPADDGTWSITVYGSAGDHPIKRLRHAASFDAVVAACPAHAHWLDGEPTTTVLPMAGVTDRRRRLVDGGAPAVTGLALVGDAWACTNPSMGRGLTLGLMHARLLRDVLRTGPADPHAFALAWDAATERELTPWYDDTAEQDRAAVRTMVAARNGWTLAAPADLATALRTAVGHDADAFRLLVANRGCWTTMRDGLSEPGMAEHVRAVARAHAPARLPGPDRQGLLALLDQRVAA